MRRRGVFVLILAVVTILFATWRYREGRADHCLNRATGVAFRCFEFYDEHERWPGDLAELADEAGRIEFVPGRFVEIGSGEVSYSTEREEITAPCANGTASYPVTLAEYRKWKEGLVDR